ncbi:MAG: SNF2-related protein [Gammaproteobacteria bacterium]|nr:SNF2-related protein [Gammaproteobacteria bacterium]MDE0270082.1 SNF2-related protein [Gammaproteobacteria bacterium]
MTRQFNPGDAVRRKSRPDAVGVIRDAGYLEEATGQWIHRVQFGNSIRGVADTELERLPEYTDAWDEIQDGTFSSADAFRTLMTFERLRRPPSPIAASFGSAKAAFYPFQFKPLLKFLENPRKRLLIADDVGLGKTIEAGYIIRELKSRVSVERTLLAVPSRLRTKWQAEMDRRFGERFEIVTGRRIAELRKGLERRGELERFSWIVSIESARASDVTEFLEDVQPPLDIVVVDEAHRMRNPETRQHRLGKALSSCAENMVFLTATPVQTGLDNLFRLLNILDESEFQDGALFEEQCAANRPIIRAAAAIRSNPPAVGTAVSALKEMKDSPYTRPLTESDYFASLLERCRRAEPLDRDALVALQRDINELSLTGTIVSRTRKAEVIPDRTLRAAKVVAVRYTATERAFYDSVADLCSVIRPDLSGWGRALAALQAFRATASCIPAAAKGFRDKLHRGRSIVDGLARDFDDDQYDREDGALLHLESIREKLDEVTSNLARLTEEDTKYERLKDALRGIWQEDSDAGRSPRKVVLFAFFKPTLAYLSERLGNDRVQSRLINGDVPIPEREARIDEFASDPDIRLLLSSEVGSEGLDLQFASVVVNYDLPWNPMVVEQRIGRIDRIGQATPRIVILNLVASDTIEDRILYRLYERIGVFRESIGEIEPILGEPVEKLAADAIRGDLTDKEQRSLAEDSADAWRDERLKAEGLANETDSLMAADQSFLDEIEGLIGRRKVPSSAELHAYVAGYLAANFAGSRFPQGLVSGVADIRTPRDVGRLVLEAFPTDPEAVRFGRMLETGAVRATFNQDAALKHANAELIHSRHPLVQMVMKAGDRERSTMPCSFALALKPTDLADSATGLAGDLMFEIHLFDTGGIRPRVALVPLFLCEKDTFLPEDVSEDLLLSMLDHSSSLDPAPRLDPEIVSRASQRLRDQLGSRRSVIVSTERELNAVRTSRLKTTLAVALDHRVSEAELRLSSLQDKGAAPFAIKMARAKLERANRERSSRLDALDNSVVPEIETEVVAAGVLRIVAP